LTFHPKGGRKARLYPKTHHQKRAARDDFTVLCSFQRLGKRKEEHERLFRGEARGGEGGDISIQQKVSSISSCIWGLSCLPRSGRKKKEAQSVFVTCMPVRKEKKKIPWT